MLKFLSKFANLFAIKTQKQLDYEFLAGSSDTVELEYRMKVLENRPSNPYHSHTLR